MPSNSEANVPAPNRKNPTKEDLSRSTGPHLDPRGSWLPAGVQPFVPWRGVRNGHAQTIIANYFPRPVFRLAAEPETVLVDEADGSRVLCHCHWQPQQVRAQRLTALLVHGLEGSSNSRYIQAIAARAWAEGWNVIRMNMRNCGGTEELSPTLYHSGLSGDLIAVIRHFVGRFDLERLALVGYSMGGNLVLKAAAECGEDLSLRAVAAVCPCIDLAAGSDALHEPANRAYEWNFLRGLMARLRRKAKLYPEIFDTRGLASVRSLREFDDKVVSRYCQFKDADDYYFRAASARVIDRITVPTFILHSQDDPFIRLTAETRAKILANANIHFVETEHGGHCAYLTSNRGNEIHWAEAAVIRFLAPFAE